MFPWQVGMFDNSAAMTVVAPAGYVGPGDLDTYLFWGGLRAYSAAKAAATAALIRIVDSSNANATDIHCLSNGDIDNTTLNAWIVSHGTASVTKIYDQVGTCDVLNATVTNMPTITQNAIKSTFPVMAFNGTSQALQSTGTITQAQDFTFTAIVNPISTSTASVMGNGTAGNPNYMFHNLYLQMIAPTVEYLTPTATNSAAMQLNQVYFNGASSSIQTNNASALPAASSPGTGGFSSAVIAFGANQIGDKYFKGTMVQAGIKAGTITSPGGLYTNESTYWGAF